MGAFDTYAATARCPRCHDVHWLSGQIKFFFPDFGGLCGRHFEPGAPQPIDIDPADLLAPVWDDEWWKIREDGALDDLRLLAGFDDLYACTCGAPMATVLHFRVDAKAATLTQIELLHALAEGLPHEIDLAEAPPDLWQGDTPAFYRALVRLAAQPFEDRAARLRECIAARFGGPSAPDSTWTTIAAPTRCEVCGDLRERSLWTMVTHPSYPQSLLGPGWTGGVLRPGAQIAGDSGFLAEDVDRGCFLRLRHPVSGDILTILSSPHRWGCRCGAGPASLVVRFAREPGGLRLAEVTLRVVRSRADLADIDFAEAPTLSRDAPPSGARWRPASREEAIAAMLRGWRTDGPGR